MSDFLSNKTVRACRNAIEFNQIPSLSKIVPGGRDEMKLDALLGVRTYHSLWIHYHYVSCIFLYLRKWQ